MQMFKIKNWLKIDSKIIVFFVVVYFQENKEIFSQSLHYL